jgi:hypothetical protein
MKKLAFALALSFVGLVPVEPALARPPTVTNSPGYDARLAESRKAYAASLRQSNKGVTRRVARSRHSTR